MARLLNPRTPVWQYEFDDPVAITSILHFAGALRLGAAHATEIAYILQRPWIMADPGRFSANQRALSDRMQDAWGTSVARVRLRPRAQRRARISVRPAAGAERRAALGLGVPGIGL